MKKNRYAGAFKSLLRLRKNPILAARDMYAIDAMLKIERAVIGEGSFVTRFIQLFTIPRVRR